MSSAQYISAGRAYASTRVADLQRRRREHLLIGIVALLMACWLPLMAHLTVEKQHGSAFGVATASAQNAGFSPRH